MNEIIGWMIATVIITVVGGGGGYLLWLKTRPAKISWIARCYQVGDGTKLVKHQTKDKTFSIKMSDLIPYIEDRLERIEVDHGITHYKLARLNMTTNAVTADMVEVWGRGKKEVNVLVEGDTATLMKRSYDKVTGQKVFTPMPRERIELIKSEIAIKKDRLTREKDILQAITPWVVAGICMIGLIGITYFMTNSSLKNQEIISKSQDYAADKMVQATEIHREGLREIGKSINKLSQELDKVEEEPPPD